MRLVDLVEIFGPADGDTGDSLTELEFCRTLGLTVGMASTVVWVTEPLVQALGVEL